MRNLLLSLILAAFASSCGLIDNNTVTLHVDLKNGNNETLLIKKLDRETKAYVYDSLKMESGKGKIKISGLTPPSRFYIVNSEGQEHPIVIGKYVSLQAKGDYNDIENITVGGSAFNSLYKKTMKSMYDSYMKPRAKQFAELKQIEEEIKADSTLLEKYSDRIEKLESETNKSYATLKKACNHTMWKNMNNPQSLLLIEKAYRRNDNRMTMLKKFHTEFSNSDLYQELYIQFNSKK
ncbi:MAG: hypothetical protein N4A49_11760 [Marinifilaceae bacterium]|nr:hypothetical protein [Marinifilaceae bacterium]